jgi:hypothetical protein
MPRQLEGAEARRRLGDAGVRFAAWELVLDRASAISATARLGGAVALKSAAADIFHKSDLGCVALGLADTQAVGAAYDRILANATRSGSATPGRMLTERMTSGIAEVLIGVKRDPVFGPMLVVGLGGIWVEILGDVAMRLCPVTQAEAHVMFGELRGAAILTGGRGRPAADLAALAGMASCVSHFAARIPGLLELDLNPVMALTEGALAVDARIILEDEHHG